MFTNRYDPAIHLRKVLSDRGGKINPIRRLSRKEFETICSIIEEAFKGRHLPFSKGFLTYDPGNTSIVKLMAQISLPEFPEERRILPFPRKPRRRKR